jgi:hypothetical protein
MYIAQLALNNNHSLTHSHVNQAKYGFLIEATLDIKTWQTIFTLVV